MGGESIGTLMLPMPMMLRFQVAPTLGTSVMQPSIALSRRAAYGAFLRSGLGSGVAPWASPCSIAKGNGTRSQQTREWCTGRFPFKAQNVLARRQLVDIPQRSSSPFLSRGGTRWFGASRRLSGQEKGFASPFLWFISPECLDNAYLRISCANTEILDLMRRPRTAKAANHACARSSPL